MEKMNGLDLFSGIGGIALALDPWVKPVAYCENDQHACGVLMSRMADNLLQPAPIWDDVTTLRAADLPARVDIITGGFPCQDLSVAGAGKGLDGERSRLAREVFRLVGEFNPGLVFLENVPGIRTRGAAIVVGEMASLGYDCRWTTVSAASVGAPHRRCRWWCLAANPNSIALWQQPERIELDEAQRRYAEPVDKGGERNTAQPSAWPTSPDLRGMDDGLSNALDRHRGLGNSVVPQTARKAFMMLAGLSL